MTATIHSTDKIVQINGVPARIWEGTTEAGVKVHCYITRVAIDKDEPREHIQQFQQELEEHQPPSTEIAAIPLKMII